MPERNGRKEPTTVLAFRLPDSKVVHLDQLVKTTKPVGIYSPNQFARYIVDAFLRGDLVPAGRAVVTA